MSKKKKHASFINREISWLSFNERVLQEAEDVSVPLIERIRFLGIFSNNRDEFFRIRVATVKRMLKLGKRAVEILLDHPAELLEKIQQIVIRQQARFDAIYIKILKELEQHHIHIIHEKQLNSDQGKFVKTFFHANVLPTLVPIMVDTAPKFPYLKDKSLYLIIKLSRVGKKPKYALIEVPTAVVNRFIVLPSGREKQYIILLEDVIRYCLDDIFYTFEYDSIEAYTIKLTRDAELDIDNDLSKNIVEKISRGLKQRKKGQPVRLVYDNEIPDDMLDFVMKKINLRKEDSPIPGGRYHNFKDFIAFPTIGPSQLRYTYPTPLSHESIKIGTSFFKVIREKDILLSYPYQSFHHLNHLLREASIDPKVQSIQITLYRVARHSNIINALINAIKNGKSVTAVVELQARFDEETNIYWANKLQEEGAKVIYGVPGLKVHSKLFLIARKEEGRIVHYAHIGTGNFNEDSSKIYCDHSLLTADKRITDEVAKLFHFYGDNLKAGSYKHLLVAPFFMRKRLVQLINKEIKNARQRKPAYIILKMNSLVDQEMIKKLYEASCQGVRIKLIIRGICSLVPGVKNLSENIEAISIVDKYLEHSRVFVFCNGGSEKYYISSADWMSRNLDCRSEVITPIYDKHIQEELKQMLHIQWSDNTKARILGKHQDNRYRHDDSKIKIRAQEEIYKFLKEKRKKDKQTEYEELLLEAEG